MRRTLERSVAAGLSLACVTLIVIGIVQYRTTLALVDSAHWVTHTDEVLAEINTTISAMEKAETNARGFALTGQTSYIAALKDGIADVYLHDRHLRSLTSDNPRQQQRLAIFERLFAQRVALLNELVDARRTHGIDAAAQVTASVAAHEFVASITTVGQELENEELLLLQQRREAARATASRALIVIVVGTFAGLLLVAVAGITIHRGFLRRHEAEREALHEKHLLTALMDNIPDCIFFKDLESRFTRVNKACARGFGLRDPSEAVGKTDADFFGQEHAARTLADEQEILRSGRGFIGKEEQETWPDRPDTWSWTSKLPLYDVNGQLAGTFGVARDLTPRKRSEQALEEANSKLTVWVDELEARDRESVLLTEMSELLQTCLNEEEAQSVVSQFARNLFPGYSGALCLIKSSRNLVETVVAWGDTAPCDGIFQPEQCWALRRGRLHHVGPDHVAPNCAHVRAEFVGSYVCVPMMAQGESVGMLHLSTQAAEVAIDSKLRALAATFAERVGLAVANLRLREALRAQSIRDSLTGLFNRRYMEESLERELRRAERNKKPIAAIMIDLDHFKRFNDTFGHDAGDRLLREFGNLLRTRTRKEDIACRYGGEEFLLILPDAGIEDAYSRAEELRESMKHLEIATPREAGGLVTASMGIALFPDHGQNAAALLRSADSALYEAKRNGRDRVVLGNEVYV